MDWDFARAHADLEAEATLITVDAGHHDSAATVQWPRFVVTFDHMFMHSIVGPPEDGVAITRCSVVLSTPRTMVERFGLDRLGGRGGHAHSLTTHHGLLFELSDPNVLVHMVWSGGRKTTFQIRRDDVPWSRWLVVPLTVAMIRAIGDEFLRG